jgi:competence protein ComEA
MPPLVFTQARLAREMQPGLSVIPFKSLIAWMVVFVLSALCPVWIHAAETRKNPAGDRIVTPTRVKPLDINSGSINELKGLPGIDDVYAQKIVDSRPYQKKDELVSRNIIPESIFKKIKDRIITLPGN